MRMMSEQVRRDLLLTLIAAILSGIGMYVRDESNGWLGIATMVGIIAIWTMPILIEKYRAETDGK